MNRRALLASLGVLSSVTGCLDVGNASSEPTEESTAEPTTEPITEPTEEPTTEAPSTEGYDLPGEPLAHETHTLGQHSGDGRRVFDDGLTYANEDERRTPYVALLTDGSDAERFDWEYVEEHESEDRPGETRAFVEETTFDEEVLVVYQCRLPGLSDRLTVVGVGRTDTGLHAGVDFESRPGPSAEALETVLVRVSLTGGAVPKAATVALHDHVWFEDVVVRTDGSTSAVEAATM